MATCLHVKIKATEEEIYGMGIINPLTTRLLLSGRAFAVEKKERVRDGVMVYLVHPQSDTYLLWVWEKFTVDV